MGYCPQFDSIPQYMTPKEVLSMFSLIRGIPRKQIEDVTCDMAKELKLTEHFKKKINSCSGGTKRKVSACIALLGNPLVVFLDDPTTGIDPESRRKLWDMISWLRTAGSTVVLTSHSMEECEALCTNLAIMANGQLQYLGSAQYLKNKYGQVYILSIKIKESPLKHTSDMASIEAYVLDKFPGAVLEEKYRCYVTYSIVPSDIPISKIFGLMERAREQLMIEDYSLGQVTLDRVFLNLDKMQS
ncbi:phospholipid-transporting ATPase ABCA3-like [Periplaneta americana]|uniref:phospholipid-transporting ATPase ABCA3-like n=1 Tax=Periplaneta americana TaxID=6978 RepID=UPI0037E79D9F